MACRHPSSIATLDLFTEKKRSRRIIENKYSCQKQYQGSSVPWNWRRAHCPDWWNPLWIMAHSINYKNDRKTLVRWIYLFANDSYTGNRFCVHFLRIKYTIQIDRSLNENTSWRILILFRFSSQFNRFFMILEIHPMRLDLFSFCHSMLFIEIKQNK